MTRSICEFLKEKIRDFVAEKNESLRWFSRQTDVDYTTIYRLNTGEQKTLSFLNAYRILKVLSPAGYIGILGEYFPDELREIAGNAPTSIDKKAAIAEVVLRDFHTFKIYTFAATSPNTTPEKVSKKFGTDGSDCLQKLLSLGALSEENGYLIDKIDGAVLLSEESLKQNAKLNVDFVDLLKAGSHIHNIRTNLNESGLLMWYEAAIDFKKRLHEIADNEDFRGDHVVVASSITGPI